MENQDVQPVEMPHQQGESFTFSLATKNEDIANKDGFIVTVEDQTPIGVSDADIQFSDVTTGDVTSLKHGFAPKAPGSATVFLDGTGNYTAVDDADLTTSDVTTNNVSTSKHGFAPKLPNNTTTFLRGDGSYAVPTRLYANGVSSRSSATASGDQTIAHGLATTPTRVIINAFMGVNSYTTGGAYMSASVGTWDSSGQNVVFYGAVASFGAGNNTNEMIHLYSSSSAGQTATIAVDATNITISWTKVSTPAGDTMYFSWSAEA